MSKRLSGIKEIQHNDYDPKLDPEPLETKRIDRNELNSKNRSEQGSSSDELASDSLRNHDSPETDQYDDEYSEAELKQLWDDDSGYANDRVPYMYGFPKKLDDDSTRVDAEKYSNLFDETGELKKKFEEYSDLYKKTGIHSVSHDDAGEADQLDYEYSEEELQQLWDDDPGYVNDRVKYMYGFPKKHDDGSVSIDAEKYSNLFDKTGRLKKEFEEYSDFYKKTGLHSASYADDGEGHKKDKLQPGTEIARWNVPGKPGGTYFAAPDARYVDLHLPDSEDKRVREEYIVLKELGVTKSKIGAQPYDENHEYRDVLQYKTKLSVEDLIEDGFIKRKENDE